MKSERIDLGPQAVSKPVRVAICGEVSAGKSTVLNAFLRGRLLPDNLGSDVRPVVYLRPGASNDVEVLYPDGQSCRLDSVEDAAILRGAKQINLLSDQPHLDGFELIEVPFTKAEELTQDQLDLVGSADVLVWVTISSQAWRLTEKSIIEALGEARPAHGILVLSRGDKIRSNADRDKLLARVERETTEFFQHHVFVGGSGSQIEKAAKSDKVWQSIGGAKLAALLGGYVTEPSSRESRDVTQEANASNIVKMDTYKKSAAEEPPLLLVAAEPEIAEEPAQSADHPAADPTDEPPVSPVIPEGAPDIASLLRPLAETLPLGACCGFVPNASKCRCVVLSGDTEQAEAAAKACCASCDVLVQTYADGDVMFEACTFVSKGNIIVFQDIADVGLIFIVADAKALNFGIAQRMMDRLVAACQGGAA